MIFYTKKSVSDLSRNLATPSPNPHLPFNKNYCSKILLSPYLIFKICVLFCPHL